MDFLSFIFLPIFLRQLQLPPTPRIIHHPIVDVIPSSFTIQTTPKVGAFTQPKPIVNKIVNKPKIVKFGGTGGSQQQYFARVENGIVKYVVVADQSWIDQAGGTASGLWVETRNGLRKNDADVGDTYDKTLDAFIKPKPDPTATLDTQTATWSVPAKVKTQAQLLFYSASGTPVI